MKILQLNCYSYFTSRTLLEDYVDQHKIDIVLLSETWITDCNTKFKNWTNLQWKPKIHARGGVAILANHNIECVRQKDLEEDNECIWCAVRIGNKQCLICSVYIPPRNKEDLIKLHNKLNCLKSNQSLIIGSDFNARNELWDSQLLPSRDSAWQMGDNLIEMIFEHNLAIHNNDTPTFCRKDYVSALDVTLSRNLPFKINWSTDINSILKTDHYAVVINIDDNTMDTRKLKWDFKNIGLNGKMRLIILLNTGPKTYQ